jgi:hypothetical protein
MRIVWIGSQTSEFSPVAGALDIPFRITDGKSSQKIIRQSRIVIFCAAEQYAFSWLSMCLEYGRIPVVIGNTVSLPLEDRIDYSNAVFVLGEEPEELPVLASLKNLSDNKLQAIAKKGNRIFNQYYNRRTLKQTFSQLSSNYASNEADRINRPFPAFTAEGKLIKEVDLFRAMWNELCRRFPAGRSKPILLFGAGRFLKRMFAAVADMQQSPPIIGIADDRADGNKKINNLRVRKPAEFLARNFSAVLLATDSVEEVMAARCYELYGKDVNLLRPGRLMAKTASVSDNQVNQRKKIDTQLINQLQKRKPQFFESIEAVIVCVGYSDMLLWTLPQNSAEFDNIIVVTSSTDFETQQVVKANGATLVISDRYNHANAAFNKGKMLNDGLRALRYNDWVMITDADIIFNKGLRRRLSRRILNLECLYYGTRLDAPVDGLENWLKRFAEQPDLINTLTFDKPGRNRMPWGYFQLVNVGSRVFKRSDKAIYDEHFSAANDVDYAFQEKWDDNMKILLPELTVHIPHGREGVNWRGRSSKRISKKY